MLRPTIARVSFATVLAALLMLCHTDTPVATAAGLPGTIATIAGGGVGDGGPPTAGALDAPSAVTLDSSGDLYIADTYNCRVRRVSGNVITTVAGTGACGYAGDGGPATAAQIVEPRSVALDGVGDLYIADAGNCRVRRVSGGVITTVAGTGVCAYNGDGGPATTAALNAPHGVALDAAGDLYIGDTNNCRVRRVSSGIIATVAGTGVCADGGDGGMANAATLRAPTGVAFDAAGDLYIADTGSCRLRRVTSGIIATVAGTGACQYGGDGGAATIATLARPWAVALSASGDLYIADECRVRRVSGGDISTVAGTGLCMYGGDGGPATAAGLWSPTGVALDAAGDLYIADLTNHRVRRVSGGIISTVAGTGATRYGGDGGSATAAALNFPTRVALNTAGDAYVADTVNCRVRRVSGGVITTVAGSGATGLCSYSGDGGQATEATLWSPIGVALDAVGDLYIADQGNCRVRRVSGGIIDTVVGTGYCVSGGNGGAATAASLVPSDLAFNAAGDLYIADEFNCEVRRVSGGIITTVAGGGPCDFGGDGGPATASWLRFPAGVALDAVGNLYIADTGNCRVRRVSGGIITTVAGTGQCAYSGDGGPATAAALYDPQSLVVDASGDLYIADSINCRVRRVFGGIITTVAGSGGTGFCTYSGDGGLATAATLFDPYGVALDEAGDLYVADTGNHRVRIVHTSPCPFDLSKNGVVAFSDLLTFARAYNATPSSSNWNPAADFDGNGNVVLADLLLFAGSYNRAAPNCPP